jgi:hypothetical protein
VVTFSAVTRGAIYGTILHLRAVFGALGLLACTALPAVAYAQDASPPPASSTDREAAARAFTQGQRAFKKGDFRHAAESFEAAYKFAPHHSSLWNGARAWHRAREWARAANLYAKFLREAPADSRDRNSANAALKDLSTKVARIDVVATDFQDLRVDGQPVDGTSVYVNPGAHVVEAQVAGSPARQTPTVQAGDVVSVALLSAGPNQVASSSAPPPTTATPGAAPTSSAPPQQPPDAIHASTSPPAQGQGLGLSPLYVIVGGGLTAIAAGVTVWSGIDAQSARGQFNGTQLELDDGLSKEHRTNILICVTVGLGALTAATAIWLVDWHGKGDASAQVGLGPGSFALKGSF